MTNKKLVLSKNIICASLTKDEMELLKKMIRKETVSYSLHGMNRKLTASTMIAIIALMLGTVVALSISHAQPALALRSSDPDDGGLVEDDTSSDDSFNKVGKSDSQYAKPCFIKNSATGETIKIPHGSSWSDSIRVYSCNDGVITVS